jgi:hypothetical protein
LADVLGKCVHDLSYQEFNRLADDPALASVRSHPLIKFLLPANP